MMADMLAKNKTLLHLNLSHSDVGARATKRLFESLSVNRTLHTLILLDCNCSEDGGEHIGRCISSSLPSLSSLPLYLSTSLPLYFSLFIAIAHILTTSPPLLLSTYPYLPLCRRGSA